MITSVLPLVFMVVSIVVLAVTGNLFSWSPLVIAAQAAAVGPNLWAWSSFQAGVSALTLTIGIAVTVVAVARVIVEERLLRAQYPDYQQYALSTKALVPYLV